MRARPGAVPLDRDDGAASVCGAQVISGKPPKETHSRQGFIPLSQHSTTLQKPLIYSTPAQFAKLQKKYLDALNALACTLINATA